MASAPPIHTQVKSLCDAFALGAAKKGYIVATPRNHGVSGAVCFTSATHKPEEFVRRLRLEHHTELAARGGRIRFSPHFYNSMAQVDRLLSILPSDCH